MGLVRFSNCLIAEWFDFEQHLKMGKKTREMGKKFSIQTFFKSFESSTIQISGKNFQFIENGPDYHQN